MSKTETQRYKIAGPATWELIRAAYLGGESAPALAERFGVSVHAIRKRQTKEKWTKRDYAAALEARGIAPNAKPAKPDYVEEGVARERRRLMEETVRAAEEEEEVYSWVETVAAEEDASAIAEALERRALAQAGAALVRGKSSDARALASLAEQMRKRTAAAPAPSAAHAAPQPQDPYEVSEALRGEFVNEMFAKAAYLAGAMVHAPATAPAAFLDMIKEWRTINLGEGEEDAEAAARRVAEAQAHYVSGEWAETMPEEVKRRLRAKWATFCAEGEAALAEWPGRDKDAQC